MLHKAVIAGVLASILYLVYTSLYKGYIFTPILLVMTLLALLYYVMTSVVTKGMVNRKEKKDTLSARAGLVDSDNLIPGRLAFDSGRITFYRRKGDLGGVTAEFSIRTEDLESYSIGKINEYHSGIRLKSIDGREYSLKSSAIIRDEKTFSDALGFTPET